MSKFFVCFMMFFSSRLVACNELTNVQSVDTKANNQYGIFYLNESSPLDDKANRAWESIDELQDLFRKIINWVPRSKYPGFIMENITVRDILKVCINADVKCIEKFLNEYVAISLGIYMPEYLDFTGYNDTSIGNCILNQQKGKYISEILKYDNEDGTYTVAIGVINDGKVLSNVKTSLVGWKVKVKTFGKVCEAILKEGTEGANRRKTYSFSVVKDVDSAIYILKVSKDKYDNFIKNAKKYNAI